MKLSIDGIPVEHVIFNQERNLDALLVDKTDIYAIQSLVKNIVYGIEKGQFAIITKYDATRLKFDDTPKFAKLLNKDIRDEVMAIYDDVKGIEFN